MMLFLGQLEQFFKVPRIAFLQQRVDKHLAQRRRNVHRQPRPRSRLMKVLKNKNERKIDLGDGLKNVAQLPDRYSLFQQAPQYF